MALKFGERVKGTVMAAHPQDEAPGSGACEVSLKDGTKAVLKYEDLVWLDKEFTDPERTSLLQRLAESLVGKEIWVVVLDTKGGHPLIGKKQTFRQPKTNAEHMIARWESAFTYNVISVIPGVAADLRLITGPRLKEQGIFCQDSARAILLRSVCDTREGLRLWDGLAPREKVDLRATMLIPKTGVLLLVGRICCREGAVFFTNA